MSIERLNNSIGVEKLTSSVLIIANLIPLIGVLFYDWDLQSVMLLYWLENLVVGAINVIRILFIAADKNIIERLFTSVFFTFHYGLFCVAHGTLLFELLSIRIDGLDDMFSPIAMIQNGSLIINYLQNTMGNTAGLALIGMIISHAFSLRTHYFKGGEMKRITVSDAMTMPYQRIVVMHIGLIGGAFLIEEFGSTVLLLVALIVAKIATDVMFHRREHRRFSAHDIDEEEGE